MGVMEVLVCRIVKRGTSETPESDTGVSTKSLYTSYENVNKRGPIMVQNKEWRKSRSRNKFPKIIGPLGMSSNISQT